MKGHVNARREAIVKIQLRGGGNRRKTVRAIIDTGFSGSLTLPASLIRFLRLKRIANQRCTLADGSVITFDVFAGRVAWNRRGRNVEIHEAQTFPLIGMELLDQHELNVRVRTDDAVTIQRLK